MKKFFENIEQKMHDAAIENEAGDFTFEFVSGNYSLEVDLVTIDKKHRSVFCNDHSMRYVVNRVCIYDGEDEDVTSKFPLSVEQLKKCAPCYSDVIDYIRESQMSKTELYFGSEANYLHYRFG